MSLVQNTSISFCVNMNEPGLDANNITLVHIYEDIFQKKRTNPIYEASAKHNAPPNEKPCLKLRRWCRILSYTFVMCVFLTIVLYCIRNEIRFSKMTKSIDSIISHTQSRDASLNSNDGLPGRDGINGSKGEPGIKEADGMDGTNGTDGRPGSNGTKGANGVDGIDGRNGTDGLNGTITIIRHTNHTIINMYPQQCAIRLLRDIATGGMGVTMKVYLSKVLLNGDRVGAVTCSSKQAKKVYFENKPASYNCYCIGSLLNHGASRVECDMYYWLCKKTV